MTQFRCLDEVEGPESETTAPVLNYLVVKVQTDMCGKVGHGTGRISQSDG